jgi:dTMP kinase
MQPTIDVAKSSNTLNKLTFVLLYACDFADRLEKEIIPALKAGFIVLADRYIFTALARAGVRDVDREWIRQLYGFAIAPHQVFYLKIDAEALAGACCRPAAWSTGNRHGSEGRRRHL